MRSPEKQRARPEVSIVVANWEGEQWIGRCLSSLQISARESGRSCEILLVDDASRDQSVELVKSGFPNVRILKKSENIGFARAINRGKVVVLANNDLLVKTPFVGSLVRWFFPDAPEAPGEIRRKSLFAVSGKTVGWYDGKPNQLCMGAIWQGGRITPAWSDPDQPAPCLFAQAGAAAYDRRLFLKLGGLSTLFEPGYWEDYDLSWRAARMGRAQLYDPQAFALHIGGGAMTKRFGADGVQLMKARNHLLFEAANLRSARLWIEWSLRMPLSLARDQAKSRSQRVYTKAAVDSVKRLGAVFQARSRLKGSISDRELL